MTISPDTPQCAPEPISDLPVEQSLYQASAPARAVVGTARHLHDVPEVFDRFGFTPARAEVLGICGDLTPERHPTGMALRIPAVLDGLPIGPFRLLPLVVLVALARLQSLCQLRGERTVIRNRFSKPDVPFGPSIPAGQTAVSATSSISRR